MNTTYDIRATVFDIQRYSVHDGPGIRTTVFLKGCPLSCAWCHNPESLCRTPQLSYIAASCIGCGACVSACANNAHTLREEGHIFEREKCKQCFKCAAVCPADALGVTGKSMTVAEVMAEVLRDKVFYGKNGGLTISGGEPFYQSEFTISLLCAAKEAGLHTCVETSGVGKIEDMQAASCYVDLFLYDCKLAPGRLHKKYTGTDGVKMRQNLLSLDRAGIKTILRCPIIPNVNDNTKHIEYIAELACRLDNLEEINLEPYHPTGISKSYSIGELPRYTAPSFNAASFKERVRDELLTALSDKVRVPVKM